VPKPLLSPLAALALGVPWAFGAAPVLAGLPFSFDSAFGRLPKNVVPVDYTISITPGMADLSIAGEETVRLE